MFACLNEIAKNYEYLIKALASFLPLLITLFMAYIAYQQWQTNERKRRQDLFEKRFDLYKRIQKKLNELIHLCYTSNKQKEDYYFKSGFLYREDIPDNYKEEFYKQMRKKYIFYEFRDEVYFLFGKNVYYRIECLQDEKMFEAYKGAFFLEEFDSCFRSVFEKYLCIESNKHWFKNKENPKKLSENLKEKSRKLYIKLLKEIEESERSNNAK